MNREDKRKHTIFIIGIIAFLILCIIIIVLFVINSRKTASLRILVAPTFATVQINDRIYKTDTTIKLEPGTVTAEISAENFTPQSVELNLNAHETTDLILYLTPEDGDLNWYYSNGTTEYSRYQTINDLLTDKYAIQYTKDHPIITSLPIIYAHYDEQYNYTEFRIDGGDLSQCQKEAFCLRITDTTGGNYDHALELIRERGYNPDDYEIIYIYKPIEPLN